jgi:hypothetical protein
MMQRTIQIEHVTIESKKRFDEVKAALEKQRSAARCRHFPTSAKRRKQPC